MKKFSTINKFSKNFNFLVIGGGIMGLTTALDLSLRGFKVDLIEKHTLGKGATLCAHMIHSGYRYLADNRGLTHLLLKENLILQNIWKNFLIKEKGLMLIVNKKSNKDYLKRFQTNSKDINHRLFKLNRKRIKTMELALNTSIVAGYLNVDYPLKTEFLIKGYSNTLKRQGQIIYENTKIVDVKFCKEKWNIKIKNTNQLEPLEKKYNVVINATGSELDKTAKKFGYNVKIERFFGSMFFIKRVITKRILTLCAPIQPGNTIIPAESGTLIGSTWAKTKKQLRDKSSVAEVLYNINKILDRKIKQNEIKKILYGERVHLAIDEKIENFSNKRDYAILDHSDDTGRDFFSVLPSKLSLSRFVAEELVDKILRKHKSFKRSKTKKCVINTI